MNTNLTTECTKCNKPCLVFAKKKISARRLETFKRVNHDFLFLCGSSVEELVSPKNFIEFHNRQNLK